MGNQDPRTLPLAQPSDFGAFKKWTYPTDDGRGLPDGKSSLGWNNGIAGLSDRGRLYVRSHEWATGVAEIEPPPGLTGMGKVIGKVATPSRLDSVDPGQGNSLRIGGAIKHNGRTIVAAHVYYGGTTAVGSHFVGTAHDAMTSPVNALKSTNFAALPAMCSSNGGLSPVPAEWQAILGGPVFSLGGCQAVISRSSYGPAVHVFNPDDLPLAGGGQAPARTLIAFPDNHQTLGAWDGPDTNGYNMNSMVAFVFIVPGSRTLAVVGGRGSTYCYGVGTSDPALAGTTDPTGSKYCYDPTDHNRGGHGYPYVNAVWLFDLDAILKAKNPWDTRPYYYGPIPSLAGVKGRCVGGAFDAQTNTAHLTFGTGDTPMEVLSMTVAVGNPPPPPPPPPDVDCVETHDEWSPWVTAPDGKTESHWRTWTQTTPKSGNGKACVWTANTSPVIEAETRDVAPPPPTSYDGTIRSITSYADKDAGLTVRIDSNGPLPLKKGQKVKITLV